MPIIARCSCGNRVGVGDAMAGRSIRCPKCGDDMLVPAAGGAAATKSAKPKPGQLPRRGEAAGGVLASSVSINPALVAGAIVVALVLAIGLGLYFGPWRVSNDWAAMQSKANDDVTDVVQFGIQAYLEQNGRYDPSSSHMTPHVDGPVMFIPPLMSFTMPPRIVFHGKTNQGNFAGTYAPATGEIVADVDFGGYSFGGLVDIKRATGQFHMTGRETKDGKITAESNGVPLVLQPPPPPSP